LLFGCVGWRVYLHYLRRRMLYPAELRRQIWIFQGFQRIWR